ncbi:polyketide synthase, partial [Nocardia sp. NPDC058497]
MAEYRLPDGSVPVLLSSDSVDGLRAEAAALRGYLEAHPEVTAERLADMLFRTRVPRRRRALILAAPTAVAAGGGGPPPTGGGRAGARPPPPPPPDGQPAVPGLGEVTA